MQQYNTCHHLDTNKLRNTAKFFAHLICHDALPWDTMSCITLTEKMTTSSGRIFIKILFQEMVTFLGIVQVQNILNDPILIKKLPGLFPTEDPDHIRFAINFFTVIQLGALTIGLREALRVAPKKILKQVQEK